MNVRRHLLAGQVIPAHPLALTPARALDERAQRALTRYYVDAGAGGIAVGVHTTQFAIHDAAVGLYRPVLELAAQSAAEWRARAVRPAARDGASTRTPDFALVAGIVGDTRQAVHEAEVARAVGYHAGLLSLGGTGGALGDVPDAALVRHVRTVAEVIPVVGFYLQPAVGGRPLGYRFWRALAEEVSNLVAIKIAPFDRYRTIDVVRAVAESGREDVALYTGNDDNIIIDLLTPFPVTVGGRPEVRRIVGGLLGQWAVWTRRAVELLDNVRRATAGESALDARWLSHAAALTDANGAFFDPQHGYAGCIPGIHEVLRRQGLIRGTWTLDAHERLSPGQTQEIDRVLRLYPELTDDVFVAEHRESWLTG